MAVYIVTGKLGGGKTLSTIAKARTYLRSGRRVACNFDLYLENLLPGRMKATYTRLPGRPRVHDLEGLGPGCDLSTYDEEANGLIILDEAALWLNSRNWNDKERGPVLAWFAHARKLGWDLMLIVQNIEVVDKQVRQTIAEHLVVCRRLDRIGVPLLSPLLRGLFGVRLKLPRIHRAKVHYGDSEQDIVADVWTYRGADLYSAYNTRQVFDDGHEYVGDERIDMRAPYTGLSSWHLKGRYRTPWRPPRWSYHALGYAALALVVHLATANLGASPVPVAVAAPAADRQPQAPQPSDSYRLAGYFAQGSHRTWIVAGPAGDVLLPDPGSPLRVVTGDARSLHVVTPAGDHRIVTASTGPRPPQGDADTENAGNDPAPASSAPAPDHAPPPLPGSQTG